MIELLLAKIAKITVVGLLGISSITGFTTLNTLEEPPEVWIERILVPPGCQFAIQMGYFEIARVLCPFPVEFSPHIKIIPPLGKGAFCEKT